MNTKIKFLMALNVCLFLALPSQASDEAQIQITETQTSAKAPAAAVTVNSNEAQAADATAISETAKSEKDIEVQLGAKSVAKSSSDPISRFLLAIGVLCILAAGAYYWLKKNGRPQNRNQGMDIKILSQHYLGPKKSLAVVRVAGESLLVGITDNNINMIKSLSLLDEDIPEALPENFASTLAKNDSVDDEGEIVTPAYTRTSAKKPTAHVSKTASRAAEQDEEEFSMSGIKDFVSNGLKNLRNLE